MFGVVEKVGHEVLSYWWYQIVGLVKVFVSFCLRGYVGHFANVHEVFDVQLKRIFFF